MPLSPTPSQRAAIEAPAGPALVLAGPGAGKTFCLIERIRFLIEGLHIAPERICAFTFTNRAAEEIAERLQREIGAAADLVKRQTIHAFCSEVLREFDAEAGLERGFGIADEEYQRALLTRLHEPFRWHTNTLNRFTRHRFLHHPLGARDMKLFRSYLRELARRNMVDFDMLVLKTAELLEKSVITAATLRARWDWILVDEFQDLNPVQYSVVRQLARDHGNLFAVGDDEQSIYSWAGAEPKLFAQFMNDFKLATKYPLEENRRCPREAFELARKLVNVNTPIFAERRVIRAERESAHPVAALTFSTDADETAWLVQDVLNDRATHQHAWGDVSILYRKHTIGDAIEVALLSAGVPCRLAVGRAIADDPIVSYVIASLRVIAAPDDPVAKAQFLQVVLPKTLFESVRARAEERGSDLMKELRNWARERPKTHEDARKIRRGFYALSNLAAQGARHQTLAGLVEELLSHRVGEYRSALEERHDELTDPAGDPAVVQLAATLRATKEALGTTKVAVAGGAGVAARGMLATAGFTRVEVVADDDDGALRDESGAPVPPLRLFKALQLLASSGFSNAFRDFTAIDTETTGRDVRTAEVIELAAVRVRDGEISGEYHTLIRPATRIQAGAQAKHGISEADLAGHPTFDEVWPAFRAFCGGDVLVAHNGYQFDFPILRRQARHLGGDRLTTYDTLPLARELHPGSRKLEDLAHAFGIDPGRAHRALDDTRTLARVFLALGEAKVARTRKTTHGDLLGHLAIALALCEQDTLGPEERLLLDMGRVVALGKYSDALEHYRQEAEHAPGAVGSGEHAAGLATPVPSASGMPATGDRAAGALASIQDVIARLGGVDLMLRLKSEKTADQRYPAAMARLRRLLALCHGGLAEQVQRILELVALSRTDGTEASHDRVNLLTLHSTKGLEFSRVYVVGAEDSELPGGSLEKPKGEAEVEEARRLLYVGMTRTKDRLVLTRVEERDGAPTFGHRFLDEMGIIPRPPGKTRPPPADPTPPPRRA